VLEIVAGIPLGARRDLERAHVGLSVDACHVDGKRVEDALASGDLGHGKVSMPRLVHRPVSRNVEAKLDDAVLRPEQRFTNRGDPRMRRKLDEPADLFGMDFYVIAIRPPADGTVRTGPGLNEGPVDVLTKLIDPLGGEHPFQADDALGVDPVAQVIDLVCCQSGYDLCHLVILVLYSFGS
jgi:hypothetical protein